MRKALAVLVCVCLLLFTAYQIVKPKAVKGNKNIETVVNQSEMKKEPDTIVLKIAHPFSESHPQHIALTQKFAPYVEEQSDWKIRVEIYPNNQLGNEKEYMEGLKNGTVEMCIGRKSLCDTFPRLKITEFPYLFENYKQAFGLLNGGLSELITQGLEEKGFHTLAWSLNGFHQVSIFDKPIKMEGNGKKIKIATPFSEQNDSILKAMGFETIQSDTDDMAMIAHRKIADGSDYPLLSSYSNSSLRGQRYTYITNHVVSADMYLVSSRFWDRLPNNYKELLKRASMETAKYEVSLLEDWEKDIIDELKANGTEINYPDLSAYKLHAVSMYSKWLNDNYDLKEVFDKLMDEKSRLY